jgi:site-specific recombinase XerD
MQNFEQTFEQWLRVKHQLANASLSAYMSDYRMWAAWCQHDIQKIQNPDRVQIVEYFNSIGKNQKPSTINRKYKTLHRYYDMLLEMAQIGFHPLDRDLHKLKPTKYRKGLVRSIKAMPAHEIELKTQVHQSDRPAIIRDKLVLSLIYDTGLNPSAVVKLCWPYEQAQTTGVYLQQNLSKIIQIKTKTSEVLHAGNWRHLCYPLSPNTIAILQIWMKTQLEERASKDKTSPKAVLHSTRHSGALTHQVLRQRIVRITQ